MAWADLQIAGNTNGSTTSVLGGTSGGVTFSSTSFSSNVFTSSPGSQTGIQIGTFNSYCVAGSFSCGGNDPFDLKVTFTLPTGISGGNPFTFSGDVLGNVFTLDNQYVASFSNPSQTFTFDNGTINGSFTFTIEENSGIVPNIPLTDGTFHLFTGTSPGETAVLADVSATWQADSSQGPAPVPEPTSIVLLASAVGGVVYLRKKAQTSQA